MTAPVKVEPCDREAAAPFFRTNWALEECLAGQRDDDERVQSFARHRLAAVEQEREACAKVCEEIKVSILITDHERALCYDHSNRLAAFIRSRNKGD